MPSVFVACSLLIWCLQARPCGNAWLRRVFALTPGVDAAKQWPNANDAISPQ
jgi:hypothetical protein